MNCSKLFVYSSSLCSLQAGLLAKLLQKRLAGQFQRPQLNILARERLLEIKAQLFQDRDRLCNAEWQKVRDSLINTFRHINNNNVDSAIMGICNEFKQHRLARDYVDFLRSSGTEPNFSTLGRLLKSYYLTYQSGGDDSVADAEEQQHIMDICANIRKKHEVLDAQTCEYLIQGLVATADNWSEGLELLEMTRLTATPSLAAYTALIVKAFRVCNLDVGWNLLEKMISEQKQPKCIVYLTYLKTISNGSDEYFRQKFLMLLEFLEKYGLIITQRVCQGIIDVAAKYPHIIAVSPSTVLHSGQCSSCRLHLTKCTVSDVEFAQLSNSFLNKVLIRKDVFQKSTPEEVEKFKRYVLETGPYDCVVDGLNVAYSMGAKMPPRFMAGLLADIVQHFKSKNKHVLILGRKHMEKWPKERMQFIKSNASVFLTTDLTHDDPFLLYATIKSGKSTDFFSRDLMRSHAFLLGPELRAIFKRWQQTHQYSLITKTRTGRIVVKDPVNYLLSAHKVNSTWHIPSRLEYTVNFGENFEVPENWLCIKFQK